MSPQPSLHIGTVDGAPDYLMHQLVSSVALPDGRIAALNAGSHELRVYDEAGGLLNRTGRQGAGPGEFRKPLRVYLLADTLAVFDDGASRLSLHGLDGQFIATRPLVRERSRLQWDEWLYDRSWIDGPSLGQGRDPVVGAVERLPAPDTSEGYRYVRVTPFGHLWVRQPADGDAATRAWRVHDLTGAQIARVNLPAGLEIHEIGADYLLGRARDSLGVEYLQRYELDARGTTMSRYAFEGDTALHRSAVDSTAAIELRGALRMLVGPQEMYYSDPVNSYRYTDDYRQLKGYELPANVEVRIVTAHNAGWTAVAMHRVTKTMCGMAVGATPPVGWTSGVAMCL